MSLIRPVALAQLASGWLLTRHPSRGLLLLGYPDDRAAARATVRVLGLRRLVQGAAELRAEERVLWAGSAVDAVHVLTCLVYARSSATGRRAALRSALVATSFAAAQAAAAHRARARVVDVAPSAPRPGRRVPVPQLPWVSTATADAWPQPRDHDQQVAVGGPQQDMVCLTGGVMDGAHVPVDPGTDHYDIVDSDRGPQRYVVTDQVSDTGQRVFALVEDPGR